MKENLTYSDRIECIDWRYSAAIVGLIKYFEFSNSQYNPISYAIEKDVLFYNSDDITRERYLAFAEEYYHEGMEHKLIEDILNKYEEYPEEEIARVNELITKRTYIKALFGKLKFDGANKQEILDIIEKNREKIIETSYVQRQYDWFLNRNAFFDMSKSVCKLSGYYIDEGKKNRTISYNFNSDTYVGTNIIEFEFIPFAFTDSFTGFFINDNSSIEQLIRVNRLFYNEVIRDNDGRNRVKNVLLKQIKESTEFIDYDVEVIMKDRFKDYFETLYIRKSAIDIIRSAANLEIFDFSYKVNEDYYINYTDKVLEAVFNGINLNGLIEFSIKNGISSYRISELIKLNIKIKGVENMEKSLNSAYACAKNIKEKLDENKVKSYRTKLISALVAKDKFRVYDVLLNLANYSEVNMNFVYSLYENFEENIDVAYAFTNALVPGDSKNDNENHNENQ